MCWNFCFHCIYSETIHPLSNLGLVKWCHRCLCDSWFTVDPQRYLTFVLETSLCAFHWVEFIERLRGPYKGSCSWPYIHLEHSSSTNYSLSNCEPGYITCFLCTEQPRKLSPFDGFTLCVSLSDALGAQSCFVLSVRSSLFPPWSCTNALSSVSAHIMCACICDMKDRMVKPPKRKGQFAFIIYVIVCLTLCAMFNKCRCLKDDSAYFF